MTIRVLVFPGGSEIGLEINQALRDCKEISLYSAGSAASNHAPYVYRHHIELPSIYEHGWIDALNRVIDENHIDVVLPAYDDIVLALARHAGSIGARIVTSPLRTCEVSRSKRATYQLLAEVVPVPRILNEIAAEPDFPVFVKPDIGQGSQGAALVQTAEHLSIIQDQYRHLGRELVVMEYLSGPEFTVDCFSHRGQGLLYCAGRERVRVRNGISVASRFVDNPVFLEYATAIAAELEFHGGWFFQLKQDRAGELKLLEVAPRIAGTMALSRAKGVNLPLLSIYEAFGMPLKVSPTDVEIEIDRALVNRFRSSVTFKTLYIDLDDTIIVNNRLNLTAMRLIFQCINENKRIVLLTRHRGDLHATLDKFRLAGLFDDAVQLDAETPKSDYVLDTSSIFVDDSFYERQRVSERHGIPTFDCSMIEMLLDDRT